MVEVEVMLL